jgi:hypothetical protein
MKKPINKSVQSTNQQTKPINPTNKQANVTNKSKEAIRQNQQKNIDQPKRVIKSVKPTNGRN